MDWYPLRFQPVYQPRVWGGRRLAERYGRPLPESGPFGESWEIADRPETSSVVANGSWSGRTLRDLMETDASGLLGDAEAPGGRFPLLVKILDAREVLSLQVHPPADKASVLGGDPKSELWYFTETEPAAEILVGLRPEITRAEFERRMREGGVDACFHRVHVHAGDAMYLPSGRVHALGAGVVLFEIQQNSDTTYRVYDWGRMGLDGKPRALHLRESLESIDFMDFEPGLVSSEWRSPVGAREEGRTLVGASKDEVRHGRRTPGPPFTVTAQRARSDGKWRMELACCGIIGVVAGDLEVLAASHACVLRPGDFCLLPAALGWVECRATDGVEWIWAMPRRRTG